MIQQHPYSNRLAEQAVQTVKSTLKKRTGRTFTNKLLLFLLNFQINPLAATGVSRTVVIFICPLWTWLDLIQDSVNHTHKKEETSFKKNYSILVWVHSFGSGPPWVVSNFYELWENLYLNFHPFGKLDTSFCPAEA